MTNTEHFKTYKDLSVQMRKHKQFAVVFGEIEDTEMQQQESGPDKEVVVGKYEGWSLSYPLANKLNK
jgi:hypothetical protein